MAISDAKLQAQLPAAALRMLIPYFEAMDRTGRKWFIEKLKGIRTQADFHYPNGRPMSPDDRVPTRPIYTPNDV